MSVKAVQIDSSFLKSIIRSAARPSLLSGRSYQLTSVFLLLFEKVGLHFLAIQKADTEGYPWLNDEGEFCV
jgi:hypothetical protein